MATEVSNNGEAEAVVMEEVFGGRRMSSRLSGQKRPCYTTPTPPKKQSSENKNKKSQAKKVKQSVKAKKLDMIKAEEANGDSEENGSSVGHALNQNGEAAAKICGEAGEGVVVPGDSTDLGEENAHMRVKETIRLFNKHYLSFVQQEEQRCKTEEVTTPKGAKSKKGKDKSGAKDAKKSAKNTDPKEGKKKGETDAKDTKRSAKRPDLKAITKMIETKTILYPQKRFGSLPGVEVGHRFYSRAEMVVVGLHSHWLNGIDFMGQSYSKLEQYKDYVFPLAVSIVLSGMYEDDLDNCDNVVYTGQGGNDLLGNKHQIKNQVMERGNLALKNNMEQCVPVRVIRGHNCPSSYCGKVYTYDGLYKVVNYWAEKGASGFTVFKYRLKRLDGQPELTTNQVRFIRAQAPTSLSELRGLICEDISGGQENIPIPATNLVDDPPVAPTGYSYCKDIQVSDGLTLPKDFPGCKCKGNCTNLKTCDCAQLNGDDFPYVHKDGGRLIEAKDVVFECGPKCGCGPGCINRISQRGLKYRLEVFRTPKKGWAVRSWDFIPSGAPVCEYRGKLMRTSDLDNVSENDYIFEIDCIQTMKGLDGRESRQGAVSMPTSALLEKSEDKKSDNAPEFALDAGPIGNVARFINHSCEPNLFVQCVVSSHHDAKLARVLLVAADNIPPLQELCYDYGYALDSVIGTDGKIKVLPCNCGAANCRKRLY